MNWLYATGIITLGLCFSGMMLIEWLIKDEIKRAKHKDEN